ncbi:MAG TPA: transcriptional regulator [Methylophilaceae bacterium]|nr:transcriptional regulator [Methylophilaceae bacterium]
MEEELLKSFGKHVKAIRLSLNISQEELALKADLDRTYISGIERGLRNVSLINIVKLANALNISVTAIVDFDGQHHG